MKKNKMKVGFMNLVLAGVLFSSSTIDVAAASNKAVTETLRDEMIQNTTVKNLDLGDVSDLGVHISFEGEWDKIEDDTYQTGLENVFYLSYPRLLARMGTGSEATDITFRAMDEPGVAYSDGDDTVTVCVNYANDRPSDLGYFVHELAHCVQHYRGFDSGWFCENFASYAAFRYFRWLYEDGIQFSNQCSIDVIFWRFTSSGNCMQFYAYLDSKYPTRRNPDGSLSYGLLDSINIAIKNGEITTDKDYEDPEGELNKVVKRITGLNTILDVKGRFMIDVLTGEWRFTGFADYEDNFLTENIAGIEVPELPTLNIHHGTDNAVLVKEEFEPFKKNILNGGTIIRRSGSTADEPHTNLIDGDLETRWYGENGYLQDYSYQIEGVEHFVVIDLGSEKNFNAYSIANGGSRGGFYDNASSWELLTSHDGITFKSLDYKEDCRYDNATFQLDKTHKCRYVMFKIYSADTGDGTVRMYELSMGKLK